MEAQNDQNSEKENCIEKPTSQTKDGNNNDNTVTGESPSCWRTPPNFIMNVVEIFERAKI